MYWVIFIVFMLLSLVVSTMLNSKIGKYSKMPISSGLSGKEIAEKMLHDNGIYDVRVTKIKGRLTDHYNPANKTVNLSDGVYEGRSIASAAIAAHECGHVVQHATAYRWLAMRTRMVPVVQFGANWSQWILLVGLLMMIFTKIVGWWVCIAGIILFALTTLFALITLPVEYNASARAVAWLDRVGITVGKETVLAKDALQWAARTYLVAALASLATLLYYLAIIFTHRR